MKRISVTAATIALAAGVLFTAAPAQADVVHTATKHAGSSSETRPTGTSLIETINHFIQLHRLQRAPHMSPHGLSHSVRSAHAPGK